MDENVSLMHKNVNDLTVGDALKINAGIVAICVAVPTAIWAVGAAADKIRYKLAERKDRKTENN